MACSREGKGDIALVGATVVALFQSFSFCLYHIGASRIQRPLSYILHTALLNFVIGSLLWFAVGYSMVFGKSQKGFIGTMNHALLLDLQGLRFSGNETLGSTKSCSDVVMVTFEMAFAIMAPLMVVITWVEYIKPAGAMLFLTLWPILVYYPLAHWIRGSGWLSNIINVVDFAGGLTLQTTAGSSHFLITILMKKTFPASCEKLSTADQFSQKHTENSQILMLAHGSLFTAAGWYCLNAGSIRNLGNSHSLVLLNTHLAACGSVVFWLLPFFMHGQWTLGDCLNGFMAGLAGACSFSGYVETWSSLVIGCAIGFVSCVLFTITKSHAPLCTREEAIDITFIFGVPGILGSVCAGFFSRTSVNSKAENGALFSNAIQLIYQLAGILIAIVWPFVWTFLLIRFINSTVGFFATKVKSSINYLQYENCFTWYPSASEIRKRNNAETSVKERLMKAARKGNLREIQELREKFGVDLGLKDFNHRTALHYACEGGHPDCVKYLVDQREVDIHAKDRYGITPLSEAVRKHRDSLVPLLLDHGANWMADGVGEILCSYVSEGKIDEVRRLKILDMDLNAEDSCRRTALHIAASKGDKLMVECLLGMNIYLNKVDVFGNRPLNCAEMHEHEEVSEILARHGALRISQSYSQREIYEESSKGNLRMIKHMVHNGASVGYCDANGRTALHASSEAGHLDLVKFLISQSGVNVNARDKKNNTPLTDAICNMHNDVAEYIQLHGGEVDERRMMHLICKATRHCDKRLLKQLLRWFNGSTVIDYDGQSAYHICVTLGNVDILRILVKAGINFSEVNFSGNTPMQLALQLKRNRSIIEILSDLEEGPSTTHVSQVTPGNRKQVPNSKSKIRRRRTRRQTRVEVATNVIPDEKVSVKSDNDAGGLLKRTGVPNILKSQANRWADAFTQQRIEETDVTGTQIEEVEVTLADIEQMNRKKHHNKQRFSEITGAPQYV